jgi:hypothetical protein
VLTGTVIKLKKDEARQPEVTPVPADKPTI